MISGMALTPTVYNEVLMDSEYEITIYPSKTYYMNLEKYRIQGNTDDIEAMPQAIFCILNTERGKYLAYSNNYGVELEELFGMPTSYCIPEIERRIREALTWDSRIDAVDNFEFEVTKNQIYTRFTAHTIFGDIDAERTVRI